RLAEVAQRARRQIRLHNRPWHLATPQPCGLATLSQNRHSLLCFSAWHARSLVQAHLSSQTSQKMALLAVGRLPGLARRCGSNFYFRRRTFPGAPILLALSRQGKNFSTWDRRTASGRPGGTPSFSRKISRN